LLNPYTLWWKYDKIGFGEGYGLWSDGYNMKHAGYIIALSLWLPRGTRGDVLGWENLWWLFLPFGLWALRKKISAWLVTGIFPALVLAYLIGKRVGFGNNGGTYRPHNLPLTVMGSALLWFGWLFQRRQRSGC
jgi:hypothetical protein